MTYQEQKEIDRKTLHLWVDELYMPNLHLYTREAHEVEAEVKQKIVNMKKWIDGLIDDKLK